MSGIASVRVYLDTCAYIEAFERNSEISQILSHLIVDRDNPSHEVSASDLIFAELLVKPIRDKNYSLVNTYHALLYELDWIEVSAISSASMLLAATLRASNSKIKLPDAIHLAQAAMSGCRTFVTDDKDLKDLSWDEAWNALELTGEPPEVVMMEQTNLETLVSSQ